MYIYEVSMIVQSTQADEWLHWMKTIHIPEVMDKGFFSSCELARITSPNHLDEMHCRITYTADSAEAIDKYRKEVSPALQEKHNAKFGEYAQGSRRELLVEQRFTSFIVR